MQCIKMLNLSMLKLIKHLTTKSKGLRWATGSLILFLLPRRDQLSLTTGEGVVDFRGSHDFRGERKGNQSSPTEFKVIFIISFCSKILLIA